MSLTLFDYIQGQDNYLYIIITMKDKTIYSYKINIDDFNGRYEYIEGFKKHARAKTYFDGMLQYGYYNNNYTQQERSSFEDFFQQIKGKTSDIDFIILDINNNLEAETFNSKKMLKKIAEITFINRMENNSSFLGLEFLLIDENDNSNEQGEES